MTSSISRGLVDLLRDAERVLVFTGAGISTGSGIADFRGPQGIWKQHRPVDIQEFLSSEVGRIEYWDQKLQAWPSFRSARPNETHAAVYHLERAGKLEMVVTQNIDGLHSQAGTSPEKLVELHGTNGRIVCLTCGELSDPGPHMASFEKCRTPPLCDCGGFLKPATISFGQSLRPEALRRAAAAAESADLVVALGSTLSVYPAASSPLVAAERGAAYVIINRGSTDHDQHPAVTLRLEGDVAKIFPPAVSEGLSSGGGVRASERP